MAQHDLLVAGFGGQGVMMLGMLFADSAVLEGRNAVYLPSYGPAMRGGTANCTVIASDEEIASPVVPNPTNVVVMNAPSFTSFESKVAPGGHLYVNSSLITAKSKRTDITVHYIPANEIAEKVGMARAANIVVLGVFIKNTNAIKSDSAKAAIKHKLGEAKAKYLEVNWKALDAGLAFNE
jgi:2-oxoglutarate ferredoxin oxidoreductase subunit gamma